MYHTNFFIPCLTSSNSSDLKLNLNSQPAVVDNLKPTEIVVSFSALSRWNEPPAPPAKEESKTALRTARGEKDKGSDRDSKAENLTVDSTSVIDGQ